MIKIEHAKKEKESIPRPQEVSIGTTFMGRIGSYKGLFLKSYDGIICLSDPVGTWHNPIQKEGEANFLGEYTPVDIKILVLDK
ncbi:MAG TPA: hypothetical protein VNZ45_02585 [Bacteroidia bacterium]|jgi:hypothetical protein|nr:hypothetical protein [Bacteroidia bacterium]